MRNWYLFICLYFAANAFLFLQSLQSWPIYISPLSVLAFFSFIGPPCMLAVLWIVAYVDRLKWYVWIASVGVAGLFCAINLKCLADALAGV